MDKRQYGIVLILAVITGFAGGALSGRVFQVRPALAQSESSEIIQARMFDLQGKEGSGSATLSIDDDGNPHLIFYDKEHQSRMMLGTDENGVSLSLFDKDGSIRMVLGVEKPGVNEEEMPYISLLDNNYGRVWSAP